MRVSTFSIYARVLAGMRSSQFAGLRAQEQLSSGRRILRPSDDPAGTARSLALRRGLAGSVRTQDALATGQSRLDLASSTLQHSSELMARSRELLLQSMSGALTDTDRESIATELTEIRKQLLEDANLQIDGSHMFGGTLLADKPWHELTIGGVRHVVYRGNGSEQMIQAGEDVQIAISADGSRIYGNSARGAARYDGLTGVRSGTTADEGTGYANLVLRHFSTDPGALAGATGVTLVNGGDGDTLLGLNALTIDAAAGTVQLGSGAVVTIPGPGERGDVVVKNEQGGTLHLDFEGWTGAAYNGTVTGNGGISLDGDTFTTLNFSETDLELSNPTLGQVLHVNTTGVLRAGRELVTFGDTTNAFDLLQGVIDDLRNDQGLDSSELLTRLSERLDGLDSVHENMLVGLGVSGARTARLAAAGARQADIELGLRGRLSQVEDADIAEVAVELARSQTILEVAQAAGARLMQTSLLNFLR